MKTLNIDSQQYHIGDQKVDGWPPPMGTSRTWDFNLSDSDIGEATLVLDVLGTEAEHNELLINDIRLGHLKKNKGKKYVASRHTVRSGSLRRRGNEVRIEAGLRGEHGHDIDDFLLRNIRLEYETQSDAPFFREVKDRLRREKFTEVRPPFEFAPLAFMRPGKFPLREQHVAAIIDGRRLTSPLSEAFRSIEEWIDDFTETGAQCVAIFALHDPSNRMVEEIKKFYSTKTHPAVVDLASDFVWFRDYWWKQIIVGD